MLTFKHHLLMMIALLVVAAIACNAPSGDTVTAEQPAEGAPPAEGQTPAEESAPPIAGGFIDSPPIDVSALPTLSIPATGVEPDFCMESFSEPAITVIHVLNDSQQLCLYHFPTEPDSPGFTLTMAAPDGTTFTDTFSYAEGPYGVEVVGSTGGSPGFVMTDLGEGSPPAIGLSISTVASVPAGEWTVSASALDGSYSVAPTPITIARYGQLVSVLTDTVGNPLATPPTIGHSGDTLYVIGAGLDPNTSITLAFYLPDPALGETEFGTAILAPLYAATVTTDGDGGFTTRFAVGDDMPTGVYFTVAQPVITPGMFVDPFTGRFTIE